MCSRVSSWAPPVRTWFLDESARARQQLPHARVGPGLRASEQGSSLRAAGSTLGQFSSPFQRGASKPSSEAGKRVIVGSQRFGPLASPPPSGVPLGPPQEEGCVCVRMWSVAVEAGPGVVEALIVDPAFARRAPREQFRILKVSTSLTSERPFSALAFMLQ